MPHKASCTCQKKVARHLMADTTAIFPIPPSFTYSLSGGRRQGSANQPSHCSQCTHLKHVPPFRRIKKS
uniref:Uncharacterized protein n=1 Tax=Anguilla anguilla TaxID=7936 RepID=A0A0E9WSA4_ANGAN